MSRSRWVAGGLAAVVLVVGALTGCVASGEPGASPSESGTSSASGLSGAAWLDGGHGAAVITFGSSGCPPQVGEVTADGQKLTVDFPQETSDKACTSDYAPRASYIGIPDGVDATKDVEIVATGMFSGTATLSGLAAGTGTANQEPSAGWVEDIPQGAGLPEGSFAFVTWGSSTCAPSIGAVTATSAGTMTLELVQKGTGACTQDIAPRAGVTQAPPQVTGSDVTVTFQGPQIAGSSKMLGTR